MKKPIVAIVALGAVASLGAIAGIASAGTNTPVVRHRQARQQKRIANGVNSGELTPSETARLENEEAKIQADKKAAKADGKVTAGERAQLQHEQNKASRHIYRKKHNNRTR